jgi:hypothetical protein
MYNFCDLYNLQIQLMENTVITLAKDEKEKSSPRKEFVEMSKISMYSFHLPLPEIAC